MASRTAFVAVVIASLVLGGAPASGQGQAVDVQDNSFAPDAVTVSAGDTVTWTQSGSNPHSVTADDGSFDSHPNCPPVCMGQGDTFTHTFERPGRFSYHCKIHGSPGQGMSGVVSVERAGDEPTDVPEDNGQEPGSDDDDDTGDADPTQAPDSSAADPSAEDEVAADDSEGLPRTGPPLPVLLLGAALIVGAVVAFRRR